MRLSIATKIFISFAAVIIAFTAVLMTSTWRTRRLQEQVQTINLSIMPLSLMLSDAQNDLKSFELAASQDDPDELYRTLRLASTLSFTPRHIGAKLERAASLSRPALFEALDAPERARLVDLHGRFAALRDDALRLHHHADALSALLDQRQDAPDTLDQRATLQRQLKQDTRALDLAILRARNDLRVLSDLAITRSGTADRANLYALAIMSALAMLVALAMLALATSSVRPLRLLTHAARRVAQGDLVAALPHAITRRGDEIAILASEFNAMAESLAARDHALRQQHAALLRSERLATVGRMTSIITHELRNPLSSISLNAEMLLDTLDRSEPEDPQHHLRTIIEEVDRLREITEQYLVYARLPPPSFSQRDLIELLRSLIDFHAFEWEQLGVEVALEVPDAPLMARLDPNQLRQAMLNLIKNAVEASPARAIVTITARDAPPDHITLTVRDQGPGVPDALRPRLFDPFFTSKPRGTGLGLAMTQQIIEGHLGTIALAPSRAGELGAEFIIHLPRDPDRAPTPDEDRDLLAP